jgi:transcriptional regulator with XRE-family HTH domain
MNFQDLHEQLRLELLRRIDRGMLTGTSLARQAGFQQAHISNFLNKKRSLSLDGLDRVLAAQNLSVDQILPLEFSASASEPPPADSIPIVSPSTAMEEPVVRPGSVIESIQVIPSRLHDNRPRPAPKYAHWQRFVAIRADPQQTAAMDPMIASGAVVVLDRHYKSLAPYRAHQRTLYAVRSATGLVLRYVEFDGGALLLRPLSLAFPVQIIMLAAHETPADYLVGRVCLVLSEL